MTASRSRRRWCFFPAALLAAVSLGGGVLGGEEPAAAPATFEKRMLETGYYCDGLNVGDFDRDGHVDVVAGPYWSRARTSPVGASSTPRTCSVGKRRVPLAAVDGTGLESRHVSRYYVKRRSRAGTGTRETTYSKYPEVVPVIDCTSHLILSAVPGRGPGSDLRQFKAALKAAAGRARIGTLLADADFDGEWVHEHVRSYGIRTIIPPERGRPSDKPPAGKWRRRMEQRFDKKKYGQRWQVETVSSMIKRLLGSALRARSYWSQCREIILRAITHDVMIVMRVRVFYRAPEAGLPTRRRLAPNPTSHEMSHPRPEVRGTSGPPSPRRRGRPP